MTTPTDEFRITRLSAEKNNYHAWAIRTKAGLINKGVWEAINPGYGPSMTPAEVKVNDRALSFLFLVVEDNYLDDIGNHVRASEAWTALEDIHTKYGLLHVLQPLRDLFNVNKKQEERMQMYLSRIMDLHRRLTSCGYGFSDKEVALIMLMGLPKPYENLILALEHDVNNITTQIVKARLAVEEKRQDRRDENNDYDKEESNNQKAFMSRKKEDGVNPRKKQTKKKFDQAATKYVKCFCCGKFGHIAKDCPETEELKKAEQKAKEEEEKQKKTAKKVTDMSSHKALCSGNRRTDDSNNHTWFLDSGATDHMSSQKTKMTNFRELMSSVEVANSETILVEGQGTLEFKPKCETDKYTIRLDEVLYVPDLDGNLMSVGRIEELGYSIEFKNGKAMVKESEEVILTAERVGRLYKIEEEVMTPLIKIAKKSNQSVWHRRLGHVHKEALSRVLNDEIHGDIEEDATCRSCMLGKMRRKSFPTGQAKRASRPLELIHSDVVGKIQPPSKGGANYIVTFIDDFTRHTSIFFMKYKSEVFEKFKEYKERSENALGLKITTLRTDNGESLSNHFDDYLRKNGIVRQLTIPGTPQQNGVAERMNQTLMNVTRCLLLDSGIPKQFWADAMSTACYLRNRCPSKSIENQIPEELWRKGPVKLDHLRTFGCRTWTVRSKLDRRSKLDPKGEEAVFIGYPSGVKGYKLWNPDTDKVFVSRDAVFDEEVYPLKIKGNVSTAEDTDQVTDDIIVFGDEDGEIDITSEDTSEDEDDTNGREEPPEVQGKQSTTISDTLVKPTIRNPPSSIEPNQTQKKKRCKGQNIDDVPLRRSERIANREKKCLTANQMSIITPDPLTPQQAMAAEDAKEWKKAMEVEMGHLKTNRTWELVPRPNDRTVVGSKWLFKKKYNNDGTLERYKARLVAKGFLQTQGMDFTDTYSPVMKMKSLRILLALAVKWNWKLRQLDITTAYLNGTLQEEVFMEQPELFVDERNGNHVCKLNKAIYGLKQAGREWNNRFDQYLKQAKLMRSKADPCIYYNLEEGIVLGVYVDDTPMITKDDETGDRFVKNLQTVFEARDLGEVNEILSIRIQREQDGSLSIDQTKYAEEVLETFGMAEARGLTTPLDPGTKLLKVPDEEWTKREQESKHIPYRQAVGSILYLAGLTRPDLAYAATYLSQFNERPTEEHWSSIKHVLRYIRKTKHYKLTFRNDNTKLTAYSDADWARDQNDRKSFTGYVFSLGGTAISWRSRKQKTTALSTVEAEYLAMCEASKEAIWIKALMSELNEEAIIREPIEIKVDNQGAICLAKNQSSSDRSKHIDLRYFFLREMVDEGKVSFSYVPTGENLADMFTKPLGARHVKNHSTKIGLEDADPERDKGKCWV